MAGVSGFLDEQGSSDIQGKYSTNRRFHINVGIITVLKLLLKADRGPQGLLG